MKSEFGLIEWIAGRSGGEGADVVLGIGDDMAVLRAGAEEVLITTDVLLEGVHFDLAKASWEQVGYKAMGCSLSDCAAMAAAPWAAVAAVSLRESMTMAEAQRLHAGMQEAAEKYGCPLVGGDTTSWEGPVTVTVTMLARAAGVRPVRRSGAKVGDAIWVTGELGGSLAGRHLTFEPRVAESRQLAKLVELHAMIDVSDGLSSDLNHICRQSGVAAVVEAAAVPISAAARGGADPLGGALNDGEDFELLFCVSAADSAKLAGCRLGVSGVKLSRIGEMVAAKAGADEPRMFLRREDGRLEVLAVRGWEHFRE